MEFLFVLHEVTKEQVILCLIFSGYEVEINDGKLKKQLDKIRNGKRD